MIPSEEILQAVARGWCDKRNENKTMDPDLAEAIAGEVCKIVNNPDMIKECIEAIECGTEEPYTTFLTDKLRDIINPEFMVVLPAESP